MTPVTASFDNESPELRALIDSAIQLRVAVGITATAKQETFASHLRNFDDSLEDYRKSLHRQISLSHEAHIPIDR